MPDPRSGPRPHLSSDDMEALRRWQETQDRKLQPTKPMVNGPDVILSTSGTVNSGSETITVPFDMPEALPVYMQRDTDSQWTWLSGGHYLMTGSADIALTGNSAAPTNVTVSGPYPYIVVPSDKFYSDAGNHVIVTWTALFSVDASDTGEALMLVTAPDLTAATLIATRLSVARVG